MEAHPRQRKIQKFAPNIVEEQIKRSNFADEVFLERRVFVIERLDHANFLLEIPALLIRSCGSVHFRTLVLGKYACHGAYGAGSTGDDNGLACFHVTYVNKPLGRDH